ncbi:LysR family transcriptional regulator [Variovorax saccharolyticus]|uniref:LysR family transcriptional regulator n=1 Tax=Variovorax saccharolyticus TaxID=3053516 RepID=UPI00257535A3|nr:LysR family transcriptional regulator [Variovorax sp. J31P216]MDM0029303.1 LysR substrate-binding domain-containing protein [Variovorax sp. J31P216]
MELSDLQVFRAVIKAGGIARAGEVLHRAQSSVSARIQVLEEKLGVELFTREGRKMHLSPSGRILATYADRLLDLASEAASAVRMDRPVGVMRLGAMESTAAVRLPEPLGRFHERYPEVALELYSGNPQQLIDQVVDGSLDAALIAEPVTDRRLASMVIYDEELVIVAEAKHATISGPKDLSSTTILAFHPGCPHRKRLEDWFARAHVTPERIVEVASYNLILGCVAVGMGIALLPRSVLQVYAERDRLSVHKLRSTFGHAKTCLIWRKEAPQANVLALSSVLLEQSRTQPATGQAKSKPG